MPFNGSGGTSQPASSLYPATGNTLIESAKANITFADIYSMLASCIVKDGQTTTTAEIEFASGIATDDIAEASTGSGVTIDGLTIKDSAIADTNGNEAILVGTTASAVNEITVTNAATGNGPQIGATGGDTNISVTLKGKGTGAVILGQSTSTDVRLAADQPIADSSGNEFVKFSKTSSAVNEITVTNAATGNAPSISATGGDTNVSLKLVPKGTGTVNDANGPIMPTGAVIPFAGTSAPDGWLFCYGQAVSRSTYAALFTAISTTYGSGDGSTTFNLPDLRGRVIAGKDDMGGTSANRLTDQSGGLNGDTLGDTGGEETHTLITAEMPSHNHGNVTFSNTWGGLNTSPSAGTSATEAHVNNTTATNTGGGGAHNNVQPTIILNYVIKT